MNKPTKSRIAGNTHVGRYIAYRLWEQIGDEVGAKTINQYLLGLPPESADSPPSAGFGAIWNLKCVIDRRVSLKRLCEILHVKNQVLDYIHRDAGSSEIEWIWCHDGRATTGLTARECAFYAVPQEAPLTLFEGLMLAIQYERVLIGRHMGLAGTFQNNRNTGTGISVLSSNLYEYSVCPVHRHNIEIKMSRDVPIDVSLVADSVWDDDYCIPDYGVATRWLPGKKSG